MATNKEIIKRVLLAVLLTIAIGICMPAASATPMGRLTLANCPGGGVTVTATTIDWSPAGDGGCVVTGESTSVAFSGGTLGPNVTGTIQDLVLGVSMLPVNNFMTFGGLSFTLTSIGPGPSTANCAGLSNFQSCAPYTGSPFALQLLPSGTQVSLSVGGTVTDSGGQSSWIGAYTNTNTGLTPAQIQAVICPGGALPCTGGGSRTATFAGDFTVTVVSQVPEPATLSSILLGGLLVAGGLFRRRSSR